MTLSRTTNAGTTYRCAFAMALGRTTNRCAAYRNANAATHSRTAYAGAAHISTAQHPIELIAKAYGL